MTARLRVYNHIPRFLDLDDRSFALQAEWTKGRLARNNPVAVLTRQTIGGSTDELANAPDRDVLLRALLNHYPERTARETLAQLADRLPPVRGRILCHLFPNGGERGSGNCFGNDRILVTLPCRSSDPESWIRFVVAHEYSHTLRGFSLVDGEMVRDYLIFEGLAMVLAESMAPQIGRLFRDEETDEDVNAFWSDADLDAAGLDGYIAQMSRKGAYEAGARVVRAYLACHRISIYEAHARGNRELYWKSGYPLLR